MTGFDLRDKGHAQVCSTAANSHWKGRAMQELAWMRSGRLKLEDRSHEEFTFEELLPTLEYLIGRAIPAPNLAGSIVLDAVRRNIIAETGKLKHTTSDIKHSRRAMTYRWASVA